ncbi:MAG: chlorite dismutase family protein [Candidatus Sumerlaeaceae bacterium]|nr:chlorite dismutase family protein [Candidatus Sumerlaeaceae bacterium]
MSEQHGSEFSPVALGTWSGGHFMHFGQDIGAGRLVELFRTAYDLGIRTFVTADVYGCGEADRLLGKALDGIERDSFRLIGAIGHDFYTAQREGEKGYPRFTDPSLRSPSEFSSYLRMAAEKSLERLGVDNFDVLLLHNPDSIGYTSEEVWDGMGELMEAGLTRMLGIAPGPANGFTLDLLYAFERFHSLIDWVMLILNPLEPWPSRLVLPAAQKHEINVLARVVDHGGLFLDGLRPGDQLGRYDHRAFRPAGWIEAAHPKLERMRQIATGRGLTLLQLACQWTLAQPAVACVVPTLIQETTPHAKPIEALLEELAALPQSVQLSAEEIREIEHIGNNAGCMLLKGASPQYLGPPQADQWPMADYHWEVARKWKIDPEQHLYCPEDPRDVREVGMPIRGLTRAMDRRLYLHFVAYRGQVSGEVIRRAIWEAAVPFPSMPWVLYADAVDVRAFAVAAWHENPEQLMDFMRELAIRPPFDQCEVDVERTMYGRTYATGREHDLEEALLKRPSHHLLQPHWNWAVWYPLRRKPEFEKLTPKEQGQILMEHAMMGRVYGECDYAHDVRLACHGLDRHDNEFIVALVGANLHRLSRLVQQMRKTRQTSEYIQSLGPFFVGRVVARSTDRPE